MILFRHGGECREAHRIAVVDGDDEMRRSISFLLQQAGYWVDEHPSGEAFVAAGQMDEIAAVILELRLPGQNGLEVLRILGETEFAPPVILLAGDARVTEAVAAMKAGAVDVLEKPCPPDKLIEAVEQLAERRARERAEREMKRAARSLISSLSGRQRQVLGGVLLGKLNKTIAFDLGISVRTVETYRSELFERLGLRSTADAIWLAVKAGWAGEMTIAHGEAEAPGGSTWPPFAWADSSTRMDAPA